MTRLERTTRIHAPLEDVYRRLIDLEHYPRFFKGLEGLRRKGAPRVWQLSMRGPQGETLVCDVQLDAIHHNNQVVSWHTIRQADIAHSGAITLKRTGEGETEVHLVVEFQPVSRQYAWEDLSAYVETVLGETLAKLKQWVETGEEAKKAPASSPRRPAADA